MMLMEFCFGCEISEIRIQPKYPDPNPELPGSKLPTSYLPKIFTAVCEELCKKYTEVAKYQQSNVSHTHISIAVKTVSTSIQNIPTKKDLFFKNTHKIFKNTNSILPFDQ